MKTQEFKGTPGPWELRSDAPYSTGGCTVFRGRAESNRTIVHMPFGRVLPCPHDSNYQEHWANARLIGAAPELLEALQGMIEMWEYAADKFDWGRSALDAKAIQLLNEKPAAAKQIIDKIIGK